MRQSILVTGGAGYVGAHACKALAASGYTPVVYDNFVSGHREAVRWGPLYEGDVRDAAQLDAAFARHRPTAVMHFAALSEVGSSWKQPVEYYQNNVVGSLVLLERALAYNVQAFVFSSTCAVYGIPDYSPINEDTKLNPINPYGRSKMMAEFGLQDAANAYGINVIALRYFNAAGASFDGEIGEDHTPETHLIPRVLHAALDQDRIFGINGGDYSTPDGSCVRDFIHVDDLAQAHLAALERLLKGLQTGFEPLNLGTGRGYSVFEVLAAAEQITGRRIRTKVGPRRRGDAPSLVADSSRAGHVLNWEPTSSDLETLISTAWAWTRRDARAVAA